MSKNGKAALVVERRWEGLNPEILALIFLRIQPLDEMVRCVTFVCKPWMEVVAGPYCWQDIDLMPWCKYRYMCEDECDPVEVDLVVENLVRRSNYTAERLSTFKIGESGFLSVANCGRCLKVLEIPRSCITDDMILKHIKPLPNLLVLDISECSKITHKGLAAFGNNCKSLVRLRRNTDPFSRLFSSIDDSEAKAIAHTMSNLKRLELWYGTFGNLGLSEILTKCKSLTHLEINGCYDVDMGILDGDLVEISNRLEYFKSHGNRYLYDYYYDDVPYVDVPSSTSD